MTARNSVAAALRRHPLAVRSVFVEVALLGGAYLVISTSQSEMANVIFGILVVFALAFGVIATLTGVTMATSRVRRG